MIKYLKTAAIISFCLLTLPAISQTQYEAFGKENELHNAMKTYNFNQLIDEPVLFMCDTIERQVKAEELNLLMKTCVVTDKKTVIKKAAETNNGYIQTLGVYKNEDALMYIKFEFDQQTSKLKEVVIEKN